MYRSIFTLLLNFILIISNAQTHLGNEWIDYDKDLFKISILEKGIYRITYNDLKKATFPVNNTSPKNFTIYHHGREVPILIMGEEDDVFNTQDYIEFYAEGNNGEQDSLLYRPKNARMNTFQSLYSDSTTYFLVIGEHGKRVQVSGNKVFKKELTEPYHIEQQIRVFNEQYSFNNSIGYPPFVMQSYYEVGEGWTGKIIVGDSLAKFPIKLENYIPQLDLQPTLECLFNGRTEVNHNIQIFLRNNQNQNRIVGQIDYFGFAPLKIKIPIAANEISSDGVIQLNSQSLKKESTEWHSVTYHKVSYPQSFDMLHKTSKSFYLTPLKKLERHISVTNAPVNALVYLITDRYNFSKIASQNETTLLTFVVDDSVKANTSVFVSGVIHKPISIEKVSRSSDYSKTTNYLIITHPKLLHSANEFANYRSSNIGGKFQANVVNIQDLYIDFGYGERTPLVIRRFMNFMISKGQKIEYLLLIGRGKSFPDNLKTDVALDLVPTMGYPGSDILLTAGLNGYDLDVQAVPTGRINAISNKEVLNYLQKVNEYESNTNDLLWKKNILHLSGGLSQTEINHFRDMLKEIEPKIQKGLLSGKVESYSKQTDNSVENIDVSKEVNRGVGMVTFIGHSSSTTTDLNIGYASGINTQLQNKIKYPLMYFNGCGVGNVFNKYDLLTTDWLLTPDKGAIAIFANSFWSYDFPTSRYINNLYEKLFEDTITAGESIGKIQQVVNAKIKSEGADMFMLSNIHQLILQGDPAIKVFPLKYPDYQIQRVFIKSKNQSTPIAANDSVMVGIIASNFGRVDTDAKLNISIKKTFSMNSIEQKVLVSNISYQDTLYITIKKESDLKSIEVQLDPDNLIIENNELNNMKEFKIDWKEAASFIVYPKDILTDQLNPLIDVYFDDRKLKNGDNVANNSLIKINLRDEYPISIADTCTINALLQLCETCDFQRIAAKNLSFTQISLNEIEAQYTLPDLPKGTYKLVVNGHDTQKNNVGYPYEISFNVIDQAELSSLLVYPSPMVDFCTFQFKIANNINPRTGIIKIFDTKAKLLDEIVFSPRVGQNDVFWRSENQIPAGIYIYKAQIEWRNAKLENFEGKIVVK